MPFPRLLRVIQHLADDIGKVIGFRSFGDLARHALGIYAVPASWLKIELAATVTLTLADVSGFIGTWFWQPPIGFAVLIGLDALNGHYGWRVANRLKAEAFDGRKALRTLSKIAATVLVLLVVHSAVRGYPYASPASHGVFWWLFTVKFGKWAEKMAALKVQEGGLPRLFRALTRHFLSSKFGPHLVDSLQDRPPPRPTGLPESASDAPFPAAND